MFVVQAPEADIQQRRVPNLAEQSTTALLGYHWHFDARLAAEGGCKGKYAEYAVRVSKAVTRESDANSRAVKLQFNCPANVLVYAMPNAEIIPRAFCGLDKRRSARHNALNQSSKTVNR